MSICALIENVRAARAHHDFLFNENDYGRAPESAVDDAIGPINDAFLALCRARPVDPAEQRLRAEYLNAELFDYIDCCEGITRAFVEPDSSNSLDDLIAVHEKALAAFDARTDDYDKENDTTGHAVDTARDALLDHRPATLAEVATKAAYMASKRTFTEWDNFDQRRLIDALTPVAGGSE